MGVLIRIQPPRKRGGRPGQAAGPPSIGELFLAMNLLDVPAEFIGLIDRYRWTIELDLRSIKVEMQMEVLRCQTPGMVE